METFKQIWTFLTPITASFLTYFIAIKGKKKDVDIEKIKNINIVLSNLLDVWSYLDKLKRFSSLNKTDLPVPFKILPRILLNSKNVNENCFKELEDSIKLLKKYDPIIYYELSGIGNRFNEFRTNFILPFINAQNQTDLNNKISETFINDIINEIKEYLISVSKHLNYKTSKKIKNKINISLEYDIEKNKKELIQNYYNLIITLIQDNEKPTFEEFEREIYSDSTQNIFTEFSKVLDNTDLHKILEMAAEDPFISVEEIKKKLQQD